MPCAIQLGINAWVNINACDHVYVKILTIIYQDFLLIACFISLLSTWRCPWLGDNQRMMSSICLIMVGHIPLHSSKENTSANKLVVILQLMVALKYINMFVDFFFRFKVCWVFNNTTTNIYSNMSSRANIQYVSRTCIQMYWILSP